MCVCACVCSIQTCTIKQPSFKSVFSKHQRCKTINSNPCRHVGVLSMTFSITKTYRQKTERSYSLVGNAGKEKIIPWLLSQLRPTQIIMSCCQQGKRRQCEHPLTMQLKLIKGIGTIKRTHTNWSLVKTK